MKNIIVHRENEVSLDFIEEINFLFKSKLLDDKCDFLGKGSCGNVYSYKGYAIKICKDEKREIYDTFILNNLDEYECFPNLYFYIPGKLMVTELITGPMIENVIETEVVAVSNWVNQLKDTFDYCISKNIVPIDLNEKNVMLTLEGQPKIVDVGSFEILKNIEQLEKAKYRYYKDLEFVERTYNDSHTYRLKFKNAI